jgi:hypothetical protein
VDLADWSLQPCQTPAARVFGLWHDEEASDTYGPLLLLVSLSARSAVSGVLEGTAQDQTDTYKQEDTGQHKHDHRASDR